MFVCLPLLFGLEELESTYESLQRNWDGVRQDAISAAGLRIRPSALDDEGVEDGLEVDPGGAQLFLPCRGQLDVEGRTEFDDRVAKGFFAS